MTPLIIDTEDALLVAKKSKAQQIGSIVQKLRKRNDARATTPYRVHRPWGWV